MNVGRRGFLGGIAAVVATAGGSQPVQQGKSALRIAHVGDPQFGFITSRPSMKHRAKERFEENYRDDFARLERALARVNELKPDLLVFGGDMTQRPGDIEKDAIGVWLEENGETYDILKLPHHGKKEKNTKDLIETVDPQIAVVTDSSDEEANQKVLDRLEKNDVQVYRSSESGTITITGNGKEDYQVSSEK